MKSAFASKGSSNRDPWSERPSDGGEGHPSHRSSGVHDSRDRGDSGDFAFLHEPNVEANGRAGSSHGSIAGALVCSSRSTVQPFRARLIPFGKAPRVRFVLLRASSPGLDRPDSSGHLRRDDGPYARGRDATRDVLPSPHSAGVLHRIRLAHERSVLDRDSGESRGRLSLFVGPQGEALRVSSRARAAAKLQLPASEELGPADCGAPAPRPCAGEIEGRRVALPSGIQLTRSPQNSVNALVEGVLRSEEAHDEIGFDVEAEEAPRVDVDRLVLQ